MSANSWSHRLVRPFARRLIGTRVTPDQLTWLRVITGGTACACFAYGPVTQMAGGVVWTFSALLDRADGELARLSKRTTPSGHRFDMRADTGVSSAMFLAVGIGLRDGPFGYWAIALGVLASLSMLLCLLWCEEIEDELEPGAIVLGGAGGFDPDDLFYLIGPFAWVGMLDYLLAGSAVVLPPATAAIGIWRWRAEARAGRAVVRPGRQTRNV
jgi:archaetidylinositol phosphate synthase